MILIMVDVKYEPQVRRVERLSNNLRIETAGGSKPADYRRGVGNEDAMRFNDLGNGRAYWIVADGMGGHVEGDKASKRVAEGIGSTLKSKLSQVDNVNGALGLAKEITSGVNLAVKMDGRNDPEGKERGAVGIYPFVWKHANGRQVLTIPSVGDCEARLVRNGRIVAKTVPENLGGKGRDNVATNVFGHNAEIRQQPVSIYLDSGDTFILNSDGVTKPLGGDVDRFLLLAVRSKKTPKEAVSYAFSEIDARVRRGLGRDDDRTLFIARFT